MSFSPITRTLLATALIAACGKSSAQPGPGGAPSTGATASSAAAPAAAVAAAAIDGPADCCEVHVTGDETFSLVGARPLHAHSGKIAAESDYWMSDDQLRQAMSALASFGNKSQADVDARVAAAMGKDPRLMLLIINCGVEGQGFFNLSPTNTSHYADVPYKPGRYRLAGADGKPGDFRAMLSIEPNGKREGFRVTEPGTVELTRFDDTGIAGTFSFKAETYDSKKSVAVTGSFDYGCENGARCRQ